MKLLYKETNLGNYFNSEILPCPFEKLAKITNYLSVHFYKDKKKPKHIVKFQLTDYYKVTDLEAMFRKYFTDYDTNMSLFLESSLFDNKTTCYLTLQSSQSISFDNLDRAMSELLHLHNIESKIILKVNHYKSNKNANIQNRK